MLVIDEPNRWSWDDVFEVLFGKQPNRGRANTPGNNGIFYAQEARQKEKSFDERRVEKK